MERGLLFSWAPRPHRCEQGSHGSGNLLGFFPQAPQAAENSSARVFPPAEPHLHGRLVRRVAGAIPSPAANGRGMHPSRPLLVVCPGWRC